MATCIKSQLEGAEAPAEAAAVAPGTSAETTGREPPTSPQPARTPSAPMQPAKPVNALGLFWQVLVARIRRLFQRPQAG
jgi:hypothetical protein